MSEPSKFEPRRYRREELISRYKISQTTYYKRLKYLKIVPERDPDSTTYLTEAQVQLLDALDEHLKKKGIMKGFNVVSLGNREELPPLEDPVNPADTPQNSPNTTIDRRLDLPPPDDSLVGLYQELDQIQKIIVNGESALVFAEYGRQQNELSKIIYQRLKNDFKTALTAYRGATKDLYTDLAEGLNIPTTNEKGKPLSGETLKREIALNATSKMVLIIANANALPPAVRHWLYTLLDQGVKLVALAETHPDRDLFRQLHPIELSGLTNAQIHALITEEARRWGLSLNPSQIAEVKTHTARNARLVKKHLAAHALGLKSKSQHNEYLDISPITYTFLFGLGAMRFIGLGIGDRAVYILGSCILLLVMMIKQIGKVKG